MRGTDLLGEGPRWNARTGRLEWVDITGRALRSWVPGLPGPETVVMPDEPSLAVARTDGGHVVAQVDRLVVGSPGTWQPLCQIDAGNPSTRLNDGCCDDRGRLWIGTYSTRGEPEAGLYRVDPDGGAVQVLGDMIACNGIAWSDDGRTAFVTDTGRGRVDAYRLDASGTGLVPDHEVLEVDGSRGRPDGLTLDRDGNLWIALWGGAHLLHIAPDGTRLAEVAAPVTYPTAVAFGDHDLGTLYVTTSRRHLPDPRSEPLAGSLLALTPAAGGRPLPAFAG